LEEQAAAEAAEEAAGAREAAEAVAVERAAEAVAAGRAVEAEATRALARAPVMERAVARRTKRAATMRMPARTVVPLMMEKEVRLGRERALLRLPTN
jgi:hypothetical protein